MKEIRLHGIYTVNNFNLHLMLLTNISVDIVELLHNIIIFVCLIFLFKLSKNVTRYF